ncbi:hypothetical protein TR2A62_3659 [Thalassobium sp. R2A62]|nr:hypothetical protein TR2A62_3659 [Thalassobium sp. R2A62]
MRFPVAFVSLLRFDNNVRALARTVIAGGPDGRHPRAELS